MRDRNNARVSAARLALAVRKLREEKDSLALAGSDPIAIIGMGCRFPGGADTPERYWAALQEGRDCTREIPAGRWVDADVLPPRLRRGGFLEEIDGFDAGYFGISPREAQSMDPQQRVLLEVVWEALWDAGVEPTGLAGTGTGVFLSIYSSDFARLQSREPSQQTAQCWVGSLHSIAAGRVSFLLNLHGPNLAIDSACSSSLVAIHLGCQSLRAGESGMAIVAASGLKLLSDDMLMFSKWGMLSSDGRCKTFDAAADGFAAAEGAGAVILKRLSDALRDGDRIRAVIRGTAVNQDGRSTVLTAPSGLAQEAVLRAALENAMLEPEEVTFIETHGTGTSLGDPIEMEAIGNVYGGSGGEAPPCILGAVKSNTGHLEASAGLAGLMKAVLCLEHGEIPKNLHFQKLNPEISLTGSRFRIPTENVPWPRGSQARAAGVSSFGLGGTNSHVIIEEAPLVPAAEGGRTIPLPARRWQRQRFPLAPPAKVQAEPPQALSTTDFVHPLLQRRVESPFLQGILFQSDVSTAAYPYLAEHRLGDRALMPFAAFLEMAAAAVRESGTDGGALGNFILHEARFLLPAGCKLQVLVRDRSIEIASQDGSGWKTNAKGSFDVSAGATETAVAETIDMAGLRARCNQSVSPSEMYRRLEQTGMRFGPSFRTIEECWSGASGAAEALVHLRLPENLRRATGRYGMHPALLDGCLQTIMAARGEATTTDLYLPIGVDRFQLRRSEANELWVHARMVSSGSETISADLTVADADGSVVARLLGFTAKRTDASRLTALAEAPGEEAALTYEIDWRATPRTDVPAKPRTGERWLLVEARQGDCKSVVKLLTERGASCETITALEFDAKAIERASWAGIVFDARGLHAARPGSWNHPEQTAVEFVLGLARGLEKSTTHAPRLWVISSSALAVLPAEDVAIEQAPLSGLIRTLVLEHPGTAATLLDAGPSDLPSGAARAEMEAMLAAEIVSGGKEPLVAFRNDARFVARLTHPDPGGKAARALRIAASGRLEDLRLEPAGRAEPGPNEVEIQVRAVGLNFRDVLTALGMLPLRAAGLGGECAGTVTRIGAAVQGLKPGDDVLAFALGSFQSFVNVAADLVAVKPVAMSFADAAGIPVVFLTAQYGLERLAKLTAGQTILIHAGAGGLGMAAIQLAQRVGATIFATAGSPEKRAYLKSLGVEHVFDSRSLAFRDQVLAATGGRGVDVVLNSLAGDFIRASFDVVARDGCFLEVGKRGIWTNVEVEALGRNIRYFPFDLGEVALEDTALIADMLRGMMARFASRELRPLPSALYDLKNATDAFRTMAQARHIGKIVLAVDDGEPPTAVGGLVAEGAVLITGGLGALGIETARWLAAQGARKIVLAGRSARENEAYPIVAELQAQGVEVVVERVDISSLDEVRRLLEKIRTAGPLKAVFHAAGVVQDSVLKNESWSSYREATAPKIAGAWNLHLLTEDDPVALTVFYSSVASILGSSGQGSYAAGNAFLDALAQHRASRGLRTLSVNWGAWASVGMAARLAPELAARLARQGITPMEASPAMAALGAAIASGRTQVAILDMDWQRFASVRPDASLIAGLVLADGTQASDPQPNARLTGAVPSPTAEETNVLERIRSAVPREREEILAAHGKACARRVLGLDANAAIEDRIPLQDIGLDSLMALEMRNELAQSLEVSLPAGLLFDYPSVGQLTEHLLGLLAKPDEEDRSIDALSEEEAERQLLEELEHADLLRTDQEKANA